MLACHSARRGALDVGFEATKALWAKTISPHPRLARLLGETYDVSKGVTFKGPAPGPRALPPFFHVLAPWPVRPLPARYAFPRLHPDPELEVQRQQVGTA